MSVSESFILAHLIKKNVSIQWGPSHVGTTDNEKAGLETAKGGHRIARSAAGGHTVAGHIWAEPGLQEMDDSHSADVSDASDVGWISPWHT